jgi:hypothetical protein
MKKIFLLALSVSCFSLLQAQQNNSVSAALQLIEKNKDATGLPADYLSNTLVSSTYNVQSTGMTMVYLQQIHEGIPVFNKMQVLAFKQGVLAHSAGHFIPDMKKAAAGYSAVPIVPATTAVGIAFGEEKISIPVLSVKTISPDGRQINYGKPAGVTEEITAELLWFPVEKNNLETVQLGWQIQIAPVGTDDIWHVRIDAKTGAVIGKVNIVIFEDFEQQKKNAGVVATAPEINRPVVEQQSSTAITNEQGKPDKTEAIANANYNVIPYPFESPLQTTAQLRSNPWTAAPGNASSLGWHSIGGTDFTISRGNNVYATEDTLGLNNNSGLPATSTTAPDPLNFVFTPNFLVEPSRNAIMQQFCITNLFYWNNIIHDISYIYGFDEVAGNFQNNNQGRGGVGNDHVMALAQSGAAGHIGGNANFATGPDGGLSRMRMYLFNPVSYATLVVNTPASIAGPYAAIESGFSTANKLSNVGPVSGQVVYYNDDAAGNTHYACNPPVNSVSGKIALIDRGFGGAICTATVPFTQKVLNAQNAGAIAVIMVNNVPGDPIIMGGTDNTITIPAVMISQPDGAILASQLANNLTVTLSGVVTNVLDGDLDNGIVTHEYTHGISNRFTGGPATASCLQNAEQGGEGWSDYVALMLTTNWATATVNDGAIARRMGTFAVGPAGIRLYPYSTNITINPLTYASMGVAPVGTEVHNIGEVWCMAAWEMTWAVIQQENNINPNLYNFNLATTTGGNSIALKLVLEGMRLQPCSPGFIDARNAILAADKNLYGGRHACAIWTAFAKRGMGYSALQGSSNVATDQTPATDMPPAPVITTAPASVTVNPGNNTSFTVTLPAAINGAFYTYVWQLSTNGGVSWNPVSNGGVYSGATTATLTLTGVTASMNGYQYRVIVQQGCNTTTSNIATLTVFNPSGWSFNTASPASAACPAPNSMDVVLGTTSTGGFSNPIALTSGPAPAGTSISFVPSATVTPGNSVTVRLSGTNTLAPGTYTVTITGTATGAPPANIVVTYTITAGAGPAITSQPANQTICAGSNTSFSATSATATSFQWQVSTDGGTTWSNVTNGGVYSGATTATLNLTNVPASFNGNRYRVIASAQCGATTSSAAILTVNSAPVITTQPQSASTCTGATQVFTVVTTGSSLSYQWQISTDNGANWNPVANGGVYSGATTASLTITGVTLGLNNNQYRVVITGLCPVSPITSNAATLTVATSLTITSQPVNVTVCAGVNTSFSVSATGASTYQWQVSTDGGATFSPVTNGGVYSGATTSTLSLTNPTTALNGNQYRVVVSSSCGTATSNSALLFVNVATSIQSITPNVTVCAGTLVVFGVATGGSGLTYQWQLSTDGGTTYSDIAGANSSTYTIPSVTAAMSGNLYRVIVTGACPPVVTSTGVLLTVVTSVNITTQPVNQTVCEGGTTSFTVAGSGAGVIYQWQVSTDGGTTWTNVTNSGVYSGATTGTLTITGATVGMSNNRYRAQLSNATCTSPGISGVAILTVNSLTAVSAQPQNATICVGGNNTFSVTATGTALTYQWQVSTDGGLTWTNITGANSSTYTATGATAAMNNNRYRVVVTGVCAPVSNSNAAILTVITPAAVTSQPANVEVCSGSSATFSVSANSVQTVIYQWQISTDGGATWTNIAGANSSTYTVTTTTTAMNGNRFRAQVSSATCSAPASSNASILTVRQLPTVGLSASPGISLLPGMTTTLTATPSASTGGVLTKTWYRDGTSFVNAGNTQVVNVSTVGAYQVKIQEAWPSGLNCSNESPVVSIIAAVSPRLFIFPNPNDGRFTVSYYNVGGVSTSRTVTVFDSKGSKVYAAKFAVSGLYTLMNVDLQAAESGIYYVVVSDASGKRLAEGKVLVDW